MILELIEIFRLKDTTHIVLSTLTFSEDLLGLLEVLLPLIPSSLVVLDISNNMLERLPISLAKCHALEELNVSSNPVISLPSWFGNLRSLRVLMAESCGLKSLPMELGGISGLHTICGRYWLPSAVNCNADASIPFCSSP